MNYNNLRIVGKRLKFLSLKRQLHDRKLPFITNNCKKTGVVDWIGAESPRKADRSYPKLVNTESRINLSRANMNKPILFYYVESRDDRIKLFIIFEEQDKKNNPPDLLKGAEDDQLILFFPFFWCVCVL